MMQRLAVALILSAVVGGAPADAQVSPGPLEPMLPMQPMLPLQPMQPYQPAAPAYQQPDVAVSPEGIPMGVVVPFGGVDNSGGPGVVVSPDGQAVGVIPGQ